MLFPEKYMLTQMLMFTNINLCFILYLRAEAVSPLNEDNKRGLPYLTEEDFRQANTLEEDELHGNDDEERWIRSGYGERTAELIRTEQTNRNGIKYEWRRWPRSQIPYEVDTTYNVKERALIAKSMQTYHEKTCIRFVPRTSEVSYIYISRIDGCYSEIGMVGGRQQVSIDDECLRYSTVVHELMHAVGFFHEHQRVDRDNYVNILWQNVRPDRARQFDKIAQAEYYGESYDYTSVMHYGSKYFSANGMNTMEAHVPGMTAVIGNRKELSAADVRKINKMYRCPSSFTPPSAILNAKQVAQPPASLVFVATNQGTATTNCNDLSSLCGLLIERCKLPLFESTMKQLCPKSCGICIGAG